MMKSVTLNNGNKFPVPGVGTLFATKEGEAEQLVKDAIDIGYRHIDTAMIYRNEKEVGAGILAKIAEGVVKREDIFLTTKLCSTWMQPELVLPACKKSLSELGLEYLDLYLIHWPIAYKPGEEFWPRDKDGNIMMIDVDFMDTWKAMEELVRLGLVKSIGVSNFNSQQVDRVLQEGTIKPVVNQVEVHPYFNQRKLIAFCKERNVVVTAYSPLGSPNALASAGTACPLQDPKLKEIASKHGKTVAQIILRYLIQHGTVPIPKSSNKKRLQENFDLFSFELNAQEVAEIDALDRNLRICNFKDGKGTKYYPFDLEY